VFVHYRLFEFIACITYTEVITDSSFVGLCVYYTSEISLWIIYLNSIFKWAGVCTVSLRPNVNFNNFVLVKKPSLRKQAFLAQSDTRVLNFEP
jgi:hypothetical protein